MGKWLGRVDGRWSDGTRSAARGDVTRLRTLIYDRRLWRMASLLLTLVLVACQESDGGGGGVDPGY